MAGKGVKYLSDTCKGTFRRFLVRLGRKGGRGLTTGVMGDPPVGRGTPGEALALAPDCHDELLQADAVHALRQVTVPVMPHKTIHL